MSYSSTNLAMGSYTQCISILKEKHGDAGGSSNAWGDRDGKNGPTAFAEIGQENRDGRITGSVMMRRSDGSYDRRSFLIDSLGTVVRWPGLSKEERDKAGWSSFQLATASFVAV